MRSPTYTTVVRGQRGVGLVEVMIAMTLGLIVTAAIVQIYLSSRKNDVLQDSLAGRQESARFAAQVIQRDAQMVAFRGCLRDLGTVRNVLDDNDEYLWNFNEHTTGFNADGADWQPALPAEITDQISPTPGTDVLTLRVIDDVGAALTTSMANSSAVLDLADDMNPVPFQVGDVALVTDCGGASIFQVSAFTPASGNVAHAAGGVLEPGNTTANISRRYTAGSPVFRIRTTSYFIADSEAGSGPALWRQIGANPPQEIAAGVENMQVMYGEDDDADLVPDAYRTAGNVTDWSQVVTVQVALLVAGVQDRVIDEIDDQPREFQLLDIDVEAPQDGRLRRVQQFTVALRNRLR